MNNGTMTKDEMKQSEYVRLFCFPNDVTLKTYSKYKALGESSGVKCFKDDHNNYVFELAHPETQSYCEYDVTGFYNRSETDDHKANCHVVVPAQFMDIMSDISVNRAKYSFNHLGHTFGEFDFCASMHCHGAYNEVDGNEKACVQVVGFDISKDSVDIANIYCADVTHENDDFGMWRKDRHGFEFHRVLSRDGCVIHSKYSETLRDVRSEMRERAFSGEFSEDTRPYLSDEEASDMLLKEQEGYE